jgi:hypothetical protein
VPNDVHVLAALTSLVLAAWAAIRALMQHS